MRNSVGRGRVVMSSNRDLNDFEAVIRECVKCGVCQAHCPTYKVTRKEGAVARGKIALAASLLNGETDLETTLQSDISMCLMCGSCMAKCPNKVPTHEIVGAVRRKISNEKGLSPIGHGVSAVLSTPGLLKTMVKAGAALSPLLLKKIPDSSGLRLRFPSPFMKERTLPEMPSKNLFDRVTEFTNGQQDRPLVGFFAGCSISYLYPEIGEAMVRVLHGLGFSVYTPRSQRCCGIPALSAGNGKLVDKLSTANVASFEKWDCKYIVTACASCNGGIGEYYRTMHKDLSHFTDKVIDFSVLLQQEGLFTRLGNMEKWPEDRRKIVTYHDPCHLRTQNITREPRELLKALPNVDFVEMEGAATCCGLGGTFSVYHYEESKKIGGRKMKGLAKSGAEQIATGCPGCIMQLQDSINHAGLQVKAVHLLELLAEALEKTA